MLALRFLIPLPLQDQFSMHECLIAFGSNQGSSIEILEQTVKQISCLADVDLLDTSKPLRTASVGGPVGQDAYLNAIIRIRTSLNPQDLHRELVRFESELGRERGQRWGARKIDLDLLLYGLLQLETESLTLPHPRMSFRRFVLEPANEIASEMVHANSCQTIGQLLRSLNERENLLVFASRRLEFPEHDQLIQGLLPTDWAMEMASDEPTLNHYKKRAKLVCFVADSRGSQPTEAPELDLLFRSAVSFPGPTLRLDRDLSKSELEINAAFEAIEPLG